MCVTTELVVMLIFYQETNKKFNRDDTLIIAESNNKYISFSINIIVESAGVSNKDGKKIEL